MIESWNVEELQLSKWALCRGPMSPTSVVTVDEIVPMRGATGLHEVSLLLGVYLLAQKPGPSEGICLSFHHFKARRRFYGEIRWVW